MGASIPKDAVGLMGGTFDPVHRGHTESALAAMEIFKLRGVVLIPARRSPHKHGANGIADRERFELLESAVGADPRFSLWDVELRREPPSFTVDTVKAYRNLWLRAYPGEQRPELAWILGDDQLPGLSKWKDVERLFSSVYPIVVQRGPMPDLMANLAAVETEISKSIADRLRAGLVPLVDPHPASATEVRRRLAEGQELGRWLHPQVESEIRARGYYGASALRES